MSGLSPVEQAVKDKYEELAESMAKFRNRIVRPDRGNTIPADWHEMLLTIRDALDLAEEIINASAEFAAEIKEDARDLRARAGEEYDRKLVDLGKTAHRREYEGAREREAAARVDNLEPERRARTQERASALADAGHRRLERSWYALRDIRKEVLTTLDSYLPWERSMERGT
jgi:hypothetical protein